MRTIGTESNTFVVVKANVNGNFTEVMDGKQPNEALGNFKDTKNVVFTRVDERSLYLLWRNCCKLFCVIAEIATTPGETRFGSTITI